MTDFEPEEDLPPVAHVTLVYNGPVAPHWQMQTRYGDQKMLDDFWTRVNARLLLLPKHDPQFRRNRERVNRDAERELIICDWDLGEDDAESTSTPSAMAPAVDQAPVEESAPAEESAAAEDAPAEEAEASSPGELDGDVAVDGAEDALDTGDADQAEHAEAEHAETEHAETDDIDAVEDDTPAEDAVVEAEAEDAELAAGQS